MSGNQISNPVALGLVALGILRKAGKLKRPKSRAEKAALAQQRAEAEAATPLEPRADAASAREENAVAAEAGVVEASRSPEPQLAAASAPEENTGAAEADALEISGPTEPPPQVTELSADQADIAAPGPDAIAEPVADEPPAPLAEPPPAAALESPIPEPEPEPAPPLVPSPEAPASQPQLLEKPRIYPVTDAVKAVLFLMFFVVYLVVEVVAAMLAYMYLNLQHVETFGYLVGLCRDLLNRFATTLEAISPDLAIQANATLLGELGAKSVLLLFLGLVVSALLRFTIWSLHWSSRRAVSGQSA